MDLGATRNIGIARNIKATADGSIVRHFQTASRGLATDRQIVLEVTVKPLDTAVRIQCGLGLFPSMPAGIHAIVIEMRAPKTHAETRLVNLDLILLSLVPNGIGEVGIALHGQVFLDIHVPACGQILHGGSARDG